MKKIKFIGALLIFAGLSLTSCSSDDDSAVAPTPAPTPDPSTGDYWPAAINNQWVFDLNGVEQDPMKMISTNTIDGKEYFTFSPSSTSAATATQRFRKLNGDYFLRTETITVPASGPLPESTTTGNEVVILKDYLAVGETWTDTYQQTTTYSGLGVFVLNFSITCTIQEKDASLTVGGVTYDNVIKLKRVQTVTSSGNPDSTYTGYYWYSKDVGPIKIVNEGNTQDLLSYDLN